MPTDRGSSRHSLFPVCNPIPACFAYAIPLDYPLSVPDNRYYPEPRRVKRTFTKNLKIFSVYPCFCSQAAAASTSVTVN